MYEYLKSNQKNQIKKIEKDFCTISNALANHKLNEWWFHEISRLDFRPVGGLNSKDFRQINFNIRDFLIISIKDFIKIFFFFIKNIFNQNHQKYLSDNIFLVEDVAWTKKNKKNLFFNLINNKIKNNKFLFLGFSNFNLKNSISLSDITTNKDRFYVIFRSFFSFFYIYFKILKIQKKCKLNKFWIKYYFFKNSFKKIYINFLICNYVKNNKFCKNLIFPYEEKTFERAILLGIKNKKKNFTLKTFAVTINPQHHLASFLKEFKGLSIPRSNMYLYSGEYYRNYFYKLGRKNILSFNKQDCIGSSKSQISNIKRNDRGKSVLILLSHIQELKEFLNYFEVEKKFIDFKFILRPYPATAIGVEKNFIANNNINNISISNDSLVNDIKKSKLVIFSATSAGIECINYGRIGIWCNLSKVGENPLFDKVQHFYPSLNPKQFYKNLKLVNNMNNSVYKKKLKFQQKICQKIYSRINIKLINKYFNS